MFGAWLQQQRIHIRMTGNTGSFRLNGLRPADLQSLGSGIRIQSHILGLERCRMISVLLQYATERRSQNTFPDIATCSGKHKGI